MAVYTQLTTADLDHVTTLFGTGPIQTVTPFAQGQENSNFRLETASSDFVLTICENKSVAEVQLLVDTLEHLAKHNYHTTQMVPTVAGASIASLNGKPLLLKTYLPGKVQDPLPLAKMAPLGRALARLHQVPAPDFLPRELNYGRQTFAPMRAAYGQDHPFLDWLEKVDTYLDAYISDDLPQALIHADVFADNVILDPARGPIIMDFEEAAHYYRLFDVGMAVVGTCRNAGQIDPDKQAALISGYRKVISLTSAEEKAIPAFINYAAAAMASWRFWQFNVVQPGAGKRAHYRELQQLVRF